MLQAVDGVGIVDREMLDAVLQELNLSSTDLANKDTQLQLGKVLNAQMFGTIDFANIGADQPMFLKFIDTETTAIEGQFQKNLRGSASIGALVSETVNEIIGTIVESRDVQALIADAGSDDAVLLNVGSEVGVKVGDRFVALENGGTVEVGGKTIERPAKRVAMLEVTDVGEGTSICKVVSKKEGIVLALEMKVKESKT